jgi:phospholipid transport system transporter-binding protein
MIRREGDRMVVGGPVTLANVTQVLTEGLAQIENGVRTVDLGEVTELDSSLVAALLAWMREARHHDAELGFINLPGGLTTIAKLYGVDQLLPAGAAPR